jgi:hypothetical protein
MRGLRKRLRRKSRKYNAADSGDANAHRLIALLDTRLTRSATIEHASLPEKQQSVDTEELGGRLRTARSDFVLTGAGVSAESGVPPS